MNPAEIAFLEISVWVWKIKQLFFWRLLLKLTTSLTLLQTCRLPSHTDDTLPSASSMSIIDQLLHWSRGFRSSSSVKRFRARSNGRERKVMDRKPCWRRNSPHLFFLLPFCLAFLWLSLFGASPRAYLAQARRTKTTPRNTEKIKGHGFLFKNITSTHRLPYSVPGKIRDDFRCP